MKAIRQYDDNGAYVNFLLTFVERKTFYFPISIEPNDSTHAYARDRQNFKSPKFLTIFLFFNDSSLSDTITMLNRKVKFIWFVRNKKKGEMEINCVVVFLFAIERKHPYMYIYRIRIPISICKSYAHNSQSEVCGNVAVQSNKLATRCSYKRSA